MPVEQQPRGASVRVDLQNEQVWRDEVLVRLTPKTFTVLRYLLEHPERLITKDELLHTLWPGTVVSEWALTRCIRELRKGLGDEAQAPHYIETVHRRGYRWIAPLATTPPLVPSSKFQVQNSQSAIVGREAELERLHGWLEKALRGERQVVFVTGEAGIGKTTLVDAFLAQVGEVENQQATDKKQKVASSLSPSPPLTSSPLLVACGQCIEHFGVGEAYLPVLVALGQLCREPRGPHLIDTLRRHAPMWLVQMPALVDAADLEGLQRQVLDATPERMLRELAEALEVLTAERGLVLFLDDLHWSDVATLDFLAFLARRRQPAQLLVLATYRPVDVIVRAHPLKSVKQELQVHGQCAELALRPLDEAAVAQYLAMRFSTVPSSPGPLPQGERGPVYDLAQVIHQRTEGNPLFMVNVVQDLVAQGVITEGEGWWELKKQAEQVVIAAPESLQQMVKTQLERLSPEEQRVLEVASVAGTEFSAAAVAAGTETAVGEVEEQCERLARRDQFLQARGTAAWPDGTVAARYGFGHALYQEVVYQRVTPGRRAWLHQRIGARAEAAYGQRAGEIATELAVHFEQGQDHGRAVHYHQQAAQTALRRYAYQEAISHLTQGIESLQRVPDNRARAQQELLLQTTLGQVFVATKGFSTPEVERAYSRARVLAQHLGDTAQFLPVSWGLCAFYSVRGQFHTARELAEQCLSVAQSSQDSALLVPAYQLLGTTVLWQGELCAARAHLEQGSALYDPQQHSALTAHYGYDPGLLCRVCVAYVLWYLGYPDQAVQKSQEVLRVARELAHPFSLVMVLSIVTMIHQWRREAGAAREYAEAYLSLATEQGFTNFSTSATMLRGWALVEQGKTEEGIAQIRQSITATRAAGAELSWPYSLAVLAEACGKVGQREEGLTVLAEALAIALKNGEQYYLPELYRLKGQLALPKFQVQSSKFKVDNPQSAIRNPQLEEAEEYFLKAIEIARHQEAKSWELRAVMSLSRLWQQQGKKKEARCMLAQVYGWFTEGFDTADLQEATALLKELTE